MATQPIERKRCLSCNRWGGVRQPGVVPGEIIYDEHNDRGPCIDGPWNGTLRGPRNACGQWVLWVELQIPPT